MPGSSKTERDIKVIDNPETFDLLSKPLPAKLLKTAKYCLLLETDTSLDSISKERVKREPEGKGGR